MSQPLIEVLDYSCNWADGESTADGCMSKLIYGLYTDSRPYSKSYSHSTFINNVGTLYLDDLLVDLKSPETKYMDCQDFTHFFNVMNASIGIQSRYERLAKTSGSFGTRPILVAPEQTGWNTDTLNSHFIVYHNSTVYDAALQLWGNLGSYPEVPEMQDGQKSFSDYRYYFIDANNYPYVLPLYSDDIQLKTTQIQ